MSAIKCLKCHGDLDAIDCRSRTHGFVYRRRKRCRSCGAKYTTYEAPEQPVLDNAIEQFGTFKKGSSRRRSW